MQRKEDNETPQARLIRKMKAEPLVPIGTVATAAVLLGGILSFKRGANPKVQQRFMRARVFAQGATLGVIGYGAYIATGDNDPVLNENYQGNLPDSLAGKAS